MSVMIETCARRKVSSVTHLCILLQWVSQVTVYQRSFVIGCTAHLCFLQWWKYLKALLQ